MKKKMKPFSLFSHDGNPLHDRYLKNLTTPRLLSNQLAAFK